MAEQVYLSPTCDSCFWFRRNQSTPATGECQRRAPAANTLSNDFRRRIFPVMQAGEGCGDYESQTCRR